jgi:hypothetical protein
MLRAAPSDAASPTKKALRGRHVSPAAAKRGASVETVHQSQERGLDLLQDECVVSIVCISALGRVIDGFPANFWMQRKRWATGFLSFSG